jgi:diguanylate cyclase (GGDEF)-like protein
MDGERLTLRWPMSITLAAYLFESIRILQAARLDQALIRGHEEDLRTFFEAFVGVVDTSGSGADRHQGMSALLGKIIRRLCAEQALIYLSDEAGMNLVRAYESGGFKDLDMFEHQANSAIVDQVLKDGTPYIDNDCRFDIKIPFSSESCAVRSILCLPLTYRARKIGVVEVLNKSDGAFTEEDRKLLEMMARPISVAVNTISRFDKAERLTITDDLTKLYNYRFLMQYLEAEVKRCLRYKKKVSLLFVDVDGFKQVNDTFGHLVGSLALAEMGQVLLKSLRETDVVGRYGGDEFVIVLPETPLNGALVIAERIRKKIEDYEFVAQDLSIRLTVSLGVANCPRHTLTAEGLIKKADAAMYRAKELTKNSIKVAV